MTKSTGRDRLQTVRARSFHIARWSLETGTTVPVSHVWSRATSTATGREPFAIDRERFGNVSCEHSISDTLICFFTLGITCLFHVVSLSCMCHEVKELAFVCKLVEWWSKAEADEMGSSGQMNLLLRCDDLIK